MFLKMNDEKGFTLVEIMIAVGLLGGLAVAGMTMFKNQNQAQKTVEANYEIITIHSQLRGVLADITNCTATFAGQNPNANPGGANGGSYNGGVVPNLKKDINNTMTNVYPIQTQLPGNVKINNYKLDKTIGGLASNETILRVSYSRGCSVHTKSSI